MLSEIFGMDGIVVVVVLAILVFGGAAIPKLARNLGSAKHQFEKGLGEGKRASAVEELDVDAAVVPVPVPVSASAPAE